VIDLQIQLCWYISMLWATEVLNYLHYF